MGIIAPKETKRDQELIKDYLRKSGGTWSYTVSELGYKYARIEGDKKIPLSAARIYDILSRNGVTRGRVYS